MPVESEPSQRSPCCPRVTPGTSCGRWRSSCSHRPGPPHNAGRQVEVDQRSRKPLGRLDTNEGRVRLVLDNCSLTVSGDSSSMSAGGPEQVRLWRGLLGLDAPEIM